MPQITCKYHPEKPARWACRYCHIDFCNQCITRNNKNTQPDCPVCSATLESLGAGNVITPFWQRIPHFFLYPANLAPLVVMLSLVIIGLLVSGSLFGFLVQLASIIVFIKYGYVILEQSAQGYLRPKPFSYSDVTEELELPFKQILIILVMYSANVFVLEHLGEGAFFISMLVSIITFPASVMVLAVEHSVFRAVNPLLVLATMQRIGLAYFILCIFLGLLLSGSWLVMDFLVGILGEDLVLPLADFVSMYFSLIMFHMMGYVIYQYHEQLGYQIEKEFDQQESVSEENQPGTASNTREFEILIQEGKQEQANTRMQKQLEENPNDMTLWQQYHKFLYVTRDRDNLQKYGSKYVSRLLHEGRPSRAMQVFMDIRQVVSDFKPASAAERFELARLLAGNGQARLAISLLNNLHRDFPSYADIPSAYYLVARLLCEQFNDDSKARAILDFVLKKYPTHARINEIREYYQVIDKLVRSE